MGRVLPPVKFCQGCRVFSEWSESPLSEHAGGLRKYFVLFPIAALLKFY